MEKNISVLMSVYKNDIPKNVVTAVESVVNQTLKPKQIVMIVDGPVPEELKQTLLDFEKKYKIYENIWLEKNLGTGGALEAGWERCKYNFIAKMDSDDISVPDRFEKEMACFEKDPELDMVGSNAQEFFVEPENLGGIKAVPETHEEIVEFLKSRSPFCHYTVMMKREALEKAGGYKPWFYAEDYYLWIRMYLAGAKFYNIQENLVYARMNYDSFARRGGLKYYKSIKGLLKIMHENKMMGFIPYTKSKMVRFVGHVLVPKKMKKSLYMKYLRKENTEDKKDEANVKEQ